ncbi:DUF2179 domain-containing protein [Rhodocytophaga aerolata]|uniref:UPF0316 protein Q0590_05825 n=1 Tax=Rhodocytophaga aerolata TaxID=455078 RepID=A0ABT8R0Z9_9BACT|nr:DUF2179 domain-containing protein [Rhodocytophaga aerolata]MDO1445758.1 DUF2179 domain-containing protein [Rhodocytophaga aerolata]
METFFTETLGISKETYQLVFLPLVIYCSRMCDVSLSTLRQIFVMSGRRNLAPVVGIFESLIWLVAISTIMQNLTNVYCYIAYAAGFASGIFLGMTIEEKLALGKVVVQVITRREATDLIDYLRSTKFGFTYVEGEGKRENVKLIFSVVQRQDLPELLSIITTFNPNAFYTVESVRYASQPANYAMIGDKGGLFSFLTNLKRR